MEKLSALLPQLGTPVLVTALKETTWDVETAVAMLRRFTTDNEEALKALHKVQKDACMRHAGKGDYACHAVQLGVFLPCMCRCHAA